MPGAPEFMQVSRHASGGIDHDSIRRGFFVQNADQFALIGEGNAMQVINALHFHIPSIVQCFYFRLVTLRRGITLQKLRKFFKRDSGIPDKGQSAVFTCIKLAYIEVNKAYFRILEGGFRRCGEIAVARPNPDHEVSLPG